MIPAGWGRPLAPWRGETTPSAVQRPMSEVLTINFVRVEAGRVNGTLAPYADPQKGGAPPHDVRRPVERQHHHGHLYHPVGVR